MNGPHEIFCADRGGHGQVYTYFEGLSGKLAEQDLAEGFANTTGWFCFEEPYAKGLYVPDAAGLHREAD